MATSSRERPRRGTCRRSGSAHTAMGATGNPNCHRFSLERSGRRVGSSGPIVGSLVGVGNGKHRIHIDVHRPLVLAMDRRWATRSTAHFASP
jgi:hypothetical protein